MDHDEARMLASARGDGELDPAREAELGAHLDACDACRAFAAALPHLSVLVTSLARERAPAGFSGRIAGRLTSASSSRERRRFIAVPALAAALVIALIAVLAGPVPFVPVPEAAAAQALSRISSLYVEREILVFDTEGRRQGTTRERTWFRAPGMVRIETITETGERILTIERPGERYYQDSLGARLDTGLLPSTTTIPQPLSATITLIGKDLGPGPDVLGRPTRRFEVRGDNRVVALVDAERYTVVGVTESVLLNKQTLEDERVVGEKRTLALQYNPDLPDDLFRIPAGVPTQNRGARDVPVSSLAAPPTSAPEGLRLVAVGADRSGGAILYVRGAFEVLVRVDAPAADSPLATFQSTTVGTRPGVFAIDLYGIPEVRFEVAAHRVAVRAALPLGALRQFAAELYAGKV